MALQILLVGQPELREKLERAELRQFAQRVSSDYHLECLNLEDSKAYVRHRLSVAGGDPQLFKSEALAYIHGRTGGIPRLINQICDLSLVYAYAERQLSIDESLVRQVLQDRSGGRAMRLFGGDSEPVAGAQKGQLLEPARTPTAL